MDVVIRMLGILRAVLCPKGPLIEYTQIYLRRKLLEIFPYAMGNIEEIVFIR